MRIPILALLLAAGCAAQVGFEGRYWVTDTRGLVRIGRAPLSTDVDLKQDLGVPETNIPDWRFTWQRGRNRLRFGYSRFAYDGDQTVSRTIVFAGRTYNFGTRVISHVTLDQFKLGWGFQFLDAGDGKFRLGTLAQTHGFIVDATLRAPEVRPTPFEEHERFGAPLPTAGLIMDINPHPMVNVFGEFSGMSVGRFGYFVESEFGARAFPVKHLSVTAGYRIFNLQAKYDPDFARLRVRGPFVGAGVRF